MKTSLLTIAGSLLLTANLSAQTAITLTQSSYNTTNIGVDSVMVTPVATTFPNLTPATNATWDMSTISGTDTIATINRVPTTLLNAQFADSVYQAFGPVTYKINVEDAITANGIVSYGMFIPKQVFNNVEGAGATVVIDSQLITLSSPDTIIKFPATIGSTWTSTYHYLFDFTVTAVPLYSNAPGWVYASIVEKESVTGWGQMRVKDINGNPSGYIAVLQVQSNIATTDTFSINDTDPNPALFAVFGVSQGETIYSYTQNYYRTMELTPLASVGYGTDATYTHPSSAQTAVQRLPAGEGVANVSNAINVNVYPNPVTNHTISVDLPSAQTGNWTYDLININGQTVATAPLTGTHSQITVAPTLAAGIYYLRVNKDNNAVCIKSLDIN
jgi:hypothetical protein